jgi:hypothetical protein
MADSSNPGPALPFGKVTAPQVPGAPDDNYDVAATHVISVKPHDLSTKAASLDTQINDLTVTLKSISGTWEALKLGWVGTTQAEADTFNTKWQAAAKEMFGDDSTPTTLSQIGPNECALGKIQNLADAAAKTYANTEESLAASFFKFGEQLGGTYKPGDWPDPNDPNADPNKHPDLTTDIPVSSTAAAPDPNASTTRDYKDDPIWEQTNP